MRTGSIAARVSAAALLAAVACGEPRPAGPAPAPGEPLEGLTDAERGRFLLGKALFERIATQDEGLGPLFNAERCSSCHDTPSVGGSGNAVPVLKATRFDGARCDLLTASGGDNIQRRVTPLLAAMGHGAETVPEGAASVFVTAPPLFGVGLIEAIPAATLEVMADPGDADGDGISGRLPLRPDGRPARFGRKGDAATVRDFVDTALRFELGLSTPEHPVEERPNGAPLPPGVDPTPEPEIDARGMDLLTEYVRFLAPPAPEFVPRGPVADSVARGEELFVDTGCARCHVPELRAGRVEAEALSLRPVRLYSDLLLHDLGGGAGDVCGPDAAPGEYRTAPLWGLRHRRPLMHDGSASSVEAAIAGHDGEARTARAAFERLDSVSRAMLIRFLRSL